MLQLRAFNADLVSQVKALEAILFQSAVIHTVLDRADRLHLPQWYLGAGGIAQTVWNYLSGNAPTAHIQDLDLIYFEAEDLGEEHERQRAEEVRALFQDIPSPLTSRIRPECICGMPRTLGMPSGPIAQWRTPSTRGRPPPLVWE
jgi:hypothetical protein